MKDYTAQDSKLSDEDLYEKLFDLAIAISNHKADISQHVIDIAGFVAVQTSIEKRFLNEVSNEVDTDETGKSKARFSNQEKREFEAERRYRDNIDWQIIQDKIKESSTKKRACELDLDRVERIFDIMRLEFKRRTKDTQYVIIKEGKQ